MKVVTWNVNSIKMRLARTIAFLERHRPDVVCLQETKTTEEQFPFAALEEVGYHAAAHCQQARNGVAILTRAPAVEPVCGFPGDPIAEQARVVSALVDGVRVVSVYVVNGKTTRHPEYQLKLAWLDALLEWIRERFDPSEPLVVAGDFNVAPDDRDVHDPKAWRGHNLATAAERARVRALLEWGLVDVLRLHHDGPGPFTWWDYRAGAFHRGWGLRLDLIFATRPLADRCSSVEVDRNERKPTAGEGKPSDHAPVIAAFD